MTNAVCDLKKIMFDQTNVHVNLILCIIRLFLFIFFICIDLYVDPYFVATSPPRQKKIDKKYEMSTSKILKK